MAHEPQYSDELFVPVDAAGGDVPADTGLSNPRFFPPPTATTPDGLLCVGGRLSPDWLLDAYSHGIFPWPIWEHEPIVWWSPEERAIIELDGFHVSRRLRRTLRSGKFQATCDRDFAGVIGGCATAPGRGAGNTWLTTAMIAAYCRMHELGHAHSVEVWCRLPLPPGEGRGEGDLARGGNPAPVLGQSISRSEMNTISEGEGMYLAGGTYGVAIGGLFAAESMFHRVRDASTVALAYLVAHLRARGYRLLDVQQWTPHTGRLGAREIPRLEYLRRLAEVTSLPVTFGDTLCGNPDPDRRA